LFLHTNSFWFHGLLWADGLPILCCYITVLVLIRLSAWAPCSLRLYALSHQCRIVLLLSVHGNVLCSTSPPLLPLLWICSLLVSTISLCCWFPGLSLHFILRSAHQTSAPLHNAFICVRHVTYWPALILLKFWLQLKENSLIGVLYCVQHTKPRNISAMKLHRQSTI
jgi:hypothetical protein